jgi:hypothetical protein
LGPLRGLEQAMLLGPAQELLLPLASESLLE